MTPTGTLSYQGTPIRLRGAMLNLTDLWQAAGRPEHRRPADWLRLAETQRLRAQAETHWTEVTDLVTADADALGIWIIDTDGCIAILRGNPGGVWAHWQLALPYARSLSPPFHRWCDTVLRAAFERPADPPAAGTDPPPAHLAWQFQQLHRRLDTLDRHAADLMFLQLSAQDLLLGKRRNFSQRSQAIIVAAVAAEPFGGQCPCCGRAPVLNEAGQPVPGAEFDHALHRGLNRPEHGWLVCAACHAGLSRGGYLGRFARLPAFRAFQDAVLAQQRRTQTPPGHSAP